MSEARGGIAWIGLLHPPTIDEHARIDGTGQHLREHLVGRGHPAYLPGVHPILDEAGHEEPLRLKGALDGPSILERRKAVEESAHGPLHLLIRVKHHAAIMQAAIAHR